MAQQHGELESFMKIGDVVILHLDPSKTWGGRHKTAVRGWQKPIYIILDRPRVEERFVRLGEGDPCVVRFASGGTACAFDTTVIDWHPGGRYPSCRIAWPKEFMTVPFRKYERVELCVPLELSMDGAHLDGEVRNLSVGGCAVRTSADVCDGAAVELTFKLPNGVPVENIRATVCKVRWLEDGTFFGCEFDEGQGDAQSDITMWIATRLERDSTRRADDVPCVLVLEESGANTAVLRDSFEQQGWDTIDVSSSVDALVRLRTFVPAALIVSQDQKDLAGLQMVRLVKSTPGLESLPVFMLGSKTGAVKEEALQAGVAEYFPAPLAALEAAQVCEAVISHVQTESRPEKEAAPGNNEGG